MIVWRSRLWSAGVRWIYFDPTQYGVLSAPRESLSNELLFLVDDEEARAFAELTGEPHRREAIASGSAGCWRSSAHPRPDSPELGTR